MMSDGAGVKIDKGNSSMKATGICLFLIAAVIYFQLLQDIWRLVAEARQAGSTVRFNRFWWTPAWGVHRAVFPSSSLRRGITARFIAIGILGGMCLFLEAWADMHSLGWFGW